MTRPTAGYADTLNPPAPGAQDAAAAVRAAHDANTRRVAVALIGHGLDRITECVGACRATTPGVCERLATCLRGDDHADAMARGVAQALGLIPTTPARPRGHKGEGGAARLRRLRAAGGAR